MRIHSQDTMKYKIKLKSNSAPLTIGSEGIPQTAG